MGETVGRVVMVAGSQITMSIDTENASMQAIRVGAMVKTPTAGGGEVVGAIREMHAEANATARATVELLGMVVSSPEGQPRFILGISQHPILGAPVLPMTEIDLTAVYARPSVANIRIGALYDDPARPAFVSVDELLARHFAVFGMTGSGKSCAVILILLAILADHPSAHIIVIDPHNEYSAAFSDLAELINVDNLDLPFWLFDFEEAVEILVRGGTMREQESQAIILKDAMTRARRHSAGDDLAAASITVDTPVPFRISDLIRFIDEAMGKLNNPDTAAPYLRLKTRLDSLSRDRRFAFMFSEQLLMRDTLSNIIGRLLRIPASGKPITIMDLSGVPSEIADVVVSLACRVTFDFCRLSEYERTPPVLLVCEEAHRYVPADERVGFVATTRAITRIAKEGRKYGVSLALVSQRPSELSAAALSQCGTIFALRLGSDLDQRFVATALSQSAQAMLAMLPSLRTQEAIISGQAVSLPMRIRFDDLPPERRPRSEDPKFSEAWQRDQADTQFLEDRLRRWREQTRNRPVLG
jgi:DNA helicase HerA-like ATPase